MYQRCISFFIVILFCLTLVAPFARSEEIVITAANFEDTSAETVSDRAKTSFIEDVKIRPLGYGLTDTASALRMSIDVDLPNYGGTIPAPVTLRGSKIQQTLIMLDGVPLSSSLGEIVDVSLYTIPEIERIEIIKGSNSAAYGESAMGGVVNIVTRKPDLDESLQFTSSQGSYGYNLYSLLMNTQKLGQGLMLGVTRNWADNDFLYEREDGTTARRLNNEYDTTSLLAKLLLDLGGWDTAISGRMVDQQLGSPGGEGSSGVLTPNDEVDTFQNFLSLSTAGDLGQNQRLEIKASRLYNRSNTFWNSTSTDSRTRLTSDYYDMFYSQKIGFAELKPGFALRKERISSDDYGIHSRTTSSGILGSALDLDPVLITLTGRYDRSSDFDGEWTYHSGALWKVMPRLSLKANIGTGYHEPAMGWLYAPSFPGSPFLFNPDLKPEKSLSWDVGPVLEFENFGMGASYYVIQYDDLIKMEFPDTGGFTYVNINKAHAAGVEAFTWISPVDSVKISLNYAVNRLRYGSGEFESKTIRLKPDEVFTVRADYLPVIYSRPANVFVAYQFREGVYTDEANSEKTGNRNILDAGVSMEVSKNATVAFKASNLLDDTSVEFNDRSQWGTYWYPVPGRTYRGSVQLSF